MLSMLSLWMWSLPTGAAAPMARLPTPAMAPIVVPTGQLAAHQSFQLGIKFVDRAEARAQPGGSLAFGSAPSAFETDSLQALLRLHTLVVTPRIHLPPDQRSAAHVRVPTVPGELPDRLLPDPSEVGHRLPHGL